MNVRTIALIFVVAVPTCVFAAHPAKPGKWEVTTEVDMPGMTTKPQPMTYTVCLSKEDLEKNPEATIPKPRSRRTGEERNDCKVSDYKINENAVTWSLKCEGGQNPVSGSGKIKYTADSYDGTMDMKIGDREMKVMYKGKWISAECDKK